MNALAYNVELSLDEIAELHVTLCLRVDQLVHDRDSKNRVISEIADRQLSRVLPMRDYFGTIMREYHSNDSI
jgi:hypothetical protein